MPVTLEPLDANFGMQAFGLDIDNIDESDRRALRQAFDRHGIILIRDMDITQEQHVAFSRIFGELEHHPTPGIRHPDYREIIVLTNASNVVAEGDPHADEIVSDLNWHSDLIYTASPSRGAVFRPIIMPPEGGDTGWIDIGKAYAALDPAIKSRISGRRIVMSSASFRDVKRRKSIGVTKTPDPYSETSFADIEHPMVYTLPETGERILNSSPLFATRIIGLPDEESSQLLAEIQRFITQDRFTYVHSWRAGDMMVWNNWRTMHRALGCKRKYLRTVQRTTILGGPLPA